MMLQCMDFNIDIGDVWKWSDNVCGAPHTTKKKVTRSRVHWHTKRRTRLRALEYVTEVTSFGHDGLHVGIHDLGYFRCLVER